LIQVAGNDVLRDEGLAYARKLDDAGVDVTVVRYENLIYDYGLLMHTRGRPLQHGKLHRVVERCDQTDAREGQAVRDGVTERPVVPWKPGNAGGGKGPQFKTNARRGEG
jgi:acetyl esterase/lipase